MDEFLIFDDPDFEKRLSEVMTGDLEQLLDQAKHSDRLLDAIFAIDDAMPDVSTMDPDTARRLTLLLAFTVGYRTGLRMP